MVGGLRVGPLREEGRERSAMLGQLHACTLSRVQLYATPWTVARQAPLSMGFPRQEYWSGLPFPPPGMFPAQGLNPHFLHWQVGSLPPSHLGTLGHSQKALYAIPKSSHWNLTMLAPCFHYFILTLHILEAEDQRVTFSPCKGLLFLLLFFSH